MHTLSKQEVQRLALHKQGLYHTPTASTPEAALQIFEQLGCVQLDTLNVVTRSQHLIFWSRMAEFQISWFQQFYEQKQLFEHYLHALSVLPMQEHAYMQPFLRRFRETRVERTPLHDQLLAAIEQHGTMTGQQAAGLLELPKTQKATWELSPVRRALDQLWRGGEIGVLRDAKFHKVYCRIEEQVPEDLLHQHITSADTVRRYVQLAVSAMGAATERDIADYFRFKRETVRPYLSEFLQVAVEGDSEPYYMRHEDAALLPFAEAPTHSTFLSPFDNLIWHRPRLEKIFDTYFRLESYVPEAQRQFGYFALPILIRGAIIGTIDLKADRKKKTLHINKLVLFDPSQEREHQPTIDSILHRLTQFLNLTH
ncbi:crosslink repair DNA glycosylase YcaQ family protein [Tumebacillus sp. BK434]|uniref:DNA glycosylase AlkZ-like family protein n=1 Tax=Tumebacillus sp. BK434 TaxID=2512169 RepID=UPI0014053963|nr:crosslink repair DNA glycosylase YcaQ family protein [Tumebacillus sp. BK434]